MKFKLKYNNKTNSAITTVLTLTATIIGLLLLLTGKHSINELDITFFGYLITLGKTISIYLISFIGLTVLFLSFFIDLFLLIFGNKFILINWIYNFVVSELIINWWWNSSSFEEILLSILTFLFLFTFYIETDKYIYALFYHKRGRKISKYSIGSIIAHTYGDTSNDGCFAIGFLIRIYKTENDKLHTTTNMLHFADSTKNGDDSNKQK